MKWIVLVPVIWFGLSGVFVAMWSAAHLIMKGRDDD